MFLATTALTNFWDKNKKILMLGQWCLRYEKRDEWRDLDFEIMPYPWDDRFRLQKAYSYCMQVSENLLPELGTLMNHIHGLSFSKSFWRIVLGSWIFFYTCRIYDRFVCLREALEQYPDLETWVAEPEYYYTPATSEDDLTTVLEDLRNLQLYSQILECLDYKFPTRSIIKIDKFVLGKYQKDKAVYSKKGLKKIIKYFYPLATALLKRRAKILVFSGIPINVLIDSMLTSGFCVIPSKLILDIKSPEPLKREMRKLLLKLPCKDDFERCLVAMLPMNFPRSYLEDFKYNYENIQKFSPKHPVTLISEDGWLTNDNFKILAALQKEKGGSLIGIQHGGGYGTFLIMDNEDLEIDIVDKFFSWGWSKNTELAEVKPMPSFKCISSRFKEPAAEKKEILFVMTSLPRYQFRFYSYTIGPQMKNYIEWCIRFLSSLPEGVRSLIRVRPYMADYGNGIADQLLIEFPSLKFDDERVAFIQSFKKSCLTVIDHHATTFLQTLAANHPTILFWNQNFCELREEAKPYFEGLKKVGIFHNTPEGAAKFLMEIIPDLEEWWEDNKLQETRRAFVDNFALCSNEIQALWVKELINLGRGTKS